MSRRYRRPHGDPTPPPLTHPLPGGCEPLTLVERLPVELRGYRTGPDGYTIDLSWFAGDTLAIPLELPQQGPVLKLLTDAWNEQRRLIATVTISITEDAP